MAIIFKDSFDGSSPFANWTVDTTIGATPLLATTNPVYSPPKSAHLTNSKNRIYHAWIPTKPPIKGYVKATFCIYDPPGTKQTRFFGDIRGNLAHNGKPEGAHQVFAIGVYNVGFTGSPSPKGIFAGGTPDKKRYQARVLAGVNSGWFNLKTRRSPGWHVFTIERSADEKTVSFYVDCQLDTVVKEVTPGGLDLVVVGSVGQSVGVVGDAYFDNVKIEI